MPRKLDWIWLDHHAGGVGDGEVGGVAVARRLAGMDGVEDSVGLDELGALGRVRF